MNYDAFLATLKRSDWVVPNRSFALWEMNEGWQVCFKRFGGRYQTPGEVTFILCVRHRSLRNTHREISSVEKHPISYPYKFTLEEVEEGELKYQGKVDVYNDSTLSVTDGWERVLRSLQVTLPKWVSNKSLSSLKGELVAHRIGAYIEDIWLEDLEAF